MGYTAHALVFTAHFDKCSRSVGYKKHASNSMSDFPNTALKPQRDKAGTFEMLLV